MGLENRVEKIVMKVLASSVIARGIRPESSFVDDLGFDSLQMSDLIVSLEAEFEINIPSEHARHLITIQDVVNYIDSDGIILRSDGKKNNYLG